MDEQARQALEGNLASLRQYAEILPENSDVLREVQGDIAEGEEILRAYSQGAANLTDEQVAQVAQIYNQYLPTPEPDVDLGALDQIGQEPEVDLGALDRIAAYAQQGGDENDDGEFHQGLADALGALGGQDDQGAPDKAPPAPGKDGQDGSDVPAPSGKVSDNDPGQSDDGAGDQGAQGAGDSFDGLSEDQLDELIEEILGELGLDGGDQGDEDDEDDTDDADQSPPQDAPAKPRGYSQQQLTLAEQQARTYADEQRAVGQKYEREALRARADRLVDSEQMLPAERDQLLAVCYALRGLGSESGVRVYSQGEAGQTEMVETIFSMFEERAELGLTRNYTQSDGKRQESLRLDIPVARNANEESADLAARIYSFMEKNGIKDFGEGMIAYDESRKGSGEIKAYAQTL